MIKIIHGTFGKKLLKKGDTIQLEKEYEEELVKKGFAIKIEDMQEKKRIYLTEEQLTKMNNRNKLTEYAESIGMETKDNWKVKELLVNILNFQEEKQELVAIEENEAVENEV